MMLSGLETLRHNGIKNERQLPWPTLAISTLAEPASHTDGVVLPHQVRGVGRWPGEDGGCWWAIAIATRTR